MDIIEQKKIICSSDLYDEQWYLTHYRDVVMLGMDPAEHFLRYGALMRRSPSKNFDTNFYLNTYTDAINVELNPLVHYLLQGKTPNRPTSHAGLRAEITTLREQTEIEWGIATQPPIPRIISYCIPLMGRFDDLKGTLRRNLDAHRSLREQVEFLIVLFGDEDETLDWIRAEFHPELADGFLRVETDNTLDSWHFGKAKNAFRPHMIGQIYSSLDADNFVTLDETRTLLGLHRKYNGYFLAHHFSGDWGDGTSGRISLPAPIYRAVGYEPLLLPRQFDEMDLILNALTRFPALPFLCLDPERNAFTKSHHFRAFFEQEKLPNRIDRFAEGERQAPLNPRGEDYTNRTPYLQDMGNFNAYLSGFMRSKDAARQNDYLNKLMIAKHALIERLPNEVIADMLFTSPSRPEVPRLGAGTVALFICVRNEAHFLPALIEHYRTRGVTAFFIVDDGSSQPVETLLPDADVHVFHPKVGTFRTAKTLWIEALTKLHLPEGNWFLTVDADEFIHLPLGFESFPALARHFEAIGAEHATGLMLDLLPAPDLETAALADAQTNFAKLFTWCCNVRSPPAPDYCDHPSIVWGFGPHMALSWRVDARYHAFGTFDSLRKIPFLRYDPARHLNQGFHTLHYTDERAAPGHDIWTARPILPVYHYKLVRLFSDHARRRMLDQAENYHHRTGENIQEIFARGIENTAARLRDLARQASPLAEALRDGLLDEL